MKRVKLPLAWMVCAVLIAMPVLCMAEDAAPTLESVKAELQNNINIVWTCVAAFLVFFMQAGFALVETGFTRAKNAVNILMKNMMDFSIGSLAFFIVGFGLMFGTSNGLFGTSMFGLAGTEPGVSWNWTFLIFQTVFAATAATIVSGAMAERTKFVSYLVYSAIISLVIYPIFGSWAWGNLLLTDNNSWLAKLGFHDFAGSTVVHSIGGWLALAGAITLGPRIGKYGADGKPRAILGHSMPLATLGVFILWFGWFGFNPGSTTAGNGMAGYIAVTTNLAGAAGALTALITSWKIIKKPDIGMTLNGALAGLVAITAPCDGVTPVSAIIIGGVAGVLVVLSVLFFDYVVKIDDPVGAISVHAVNGCWGTLSYGLFAINGGLFNGGGLKQLGIQALGAGTAFVWAFGLGIILFWILRKTIGLRTSAEEELKGLDIGEHGNEAYAGFQVFTNE
ncbi:MAG: ammonium transporter [Planctomycetes bacterium GWF2_42_9]|nr:MAG: ammonium transporter [Planctomycetes bacterium GWF2_42_9]HAL45189.1 ammonium transporter [Phycisphaerales bacterium]